VTHNRGQGRWARLLYGPSMVSSVLKRILNLLRNSEIQHSNVSWEGPGALNVSNRVERPLTYDLVQLLEAE